MFLPFVFESDLNLGNIFVNVCIFFWDVYIKNISRKKKELSLIKGGNVFRKKRSCKTVDNGRK